MSSPRERQDAVREHFRTHGLIVTNWPLRDSPLGSIVILTGCVLVGALSGVLSQSLLMGSLSGLAMATAFWKLWIPITAQLEPRGVVLTVLGRRRRISWRDIDHFEPDRTGVFLCTRSQPLYQAALRSVYLPWGKDRESLASFCRGPVARGNVVNGQ